MRRSCRKWHRRVASQRSPSGMRSGRRYLDGTVAHIVTQFDGAALLRALEAATARLEAGVDEVNALNVYPVPDGDTGTNMLHTMRSAVKYARGCDGTLRGVSAAAAQGALMGARGNSGVILSQVIRGLKEAFADKEQASVREIRRSAELARRYAHDAVSAPAPGTILTLTVAMEDAAANEGKDVVELFQTLVSAADRAIVRTREENPTNRAAGVVDGDETVMKVHVHTLKPDEIIRIGLTAGRVADVVVEDLDAMTAEHERATGIVVAPPSRGPAAPIGVVAVVPGDGFAAVARSLGATVLRGGATMNPSTEELLGAIREANARTVVVLPNDKNVVLAAQQAATHADVNVRVVVTHNVAQGMAALVAFDPSKKPNDVASEMAQVAERAHGIEVTHAIRDATIDGTHLHKGEAMALLDGKVVAHGDDEVSTLCEAARRLTETEVFTLYSGAGVDKARVAYAAQRLRAACPRASVEIVDGGQPHYPFIVAAE